MMESDGERRFRTAEKEVMMYGQMYARRSSPRRWAARG